MGILGDNYDKALVVRSKGGDRTTFVIAFNDCNPYDLARRAMVGSDSRNYEVSRIKPTDNVLGK